MKKSILFSLCVLVASGLLAQSNVSAPMNFHIVRGTIPPVLSVVPGSVQFIDDDGNGVLDVFHCLLGKKIAVAEIPRRFVEAIFAMMTATRYKQRRSHALAVCNVIRLYLCPVHNITSIYKSIRVLYHTYRKNTIFQKSLQKLSNMVLCY